MPKLTLLLFLSFLVRSVNASVPVYISPSHLIPTGHYSLESLLKSSSESRGEYWIKIRDSNQSEFWVKREDMLLPIELSRWVYIEKSGADSLGSDLMAQVEKTRFELIDFKKSHALIRNPKDLKIYTIHESHLKSDPKDLGSILLEKKSSLYKSKSGAQPVSTAEAGTKWHVLGIEPNWLKLKSSLSDKIFYVKNKSQFISRFDFSDMVKTQRGIVSGDKVRFGVDSVYEIHTRQSWLFTKHETVTGFRKPLAHGLTVTTVPPFSPVLLIDKVYSRWVKSKIKGEEVWWNLSHETSQEKILLKDFKLREVFSLSQHPLKPAVLVISGHGVYYSEDAQEYEKIEKFGDQNLPVGLDYKGRLYVGDAVSSDRGKTFQPYIRWDSVLESLKSKGVRRAHQVAVKSIDAPQNSNDLLRIKISTEGRNFEMKTRNYGMTWEVDSINRR